MGNSCAMFHAKRFDTTNNNGFYKLPLVFSHSSVPNNRASQFFCSLTDMDFKSSLQFCCNFSHHNIIWIKARADSNYLYCGSKIKMNFFFKQHSINENKSTHYYNCSLHILILWVRHIIISLSIFSIEFYYLHCFGYHPINKCWVDSE